MTLTSNGYLNCLNVKIKTLTLFTRSLSELSITALMRLPPMPVIKTFAISFGFTCSSTSFFEHQVLAKP